MLDQIIQQYYDRIVSDDPDFIETPESILEKRRETLDWVYNDLCGLLYETKYHRTHLMAFTDEEREHYYENYPEFENYMNISLDDQQAQKHGLKLLCEVFTQEELVTLLA